MRYRSFVLLSFHAEFDCSQSTSASTLKTALGVRLISTVTLGHLALYPSPALAPAPAARLRLALAPDFAPAPVLLMQLLLQDKLTAPTPKPFLCDLYQTLNSLQDLKPWSYTELGTLPETFDFRSGLL